MKMLFVLFALFSITSKLLANCDGCDDGWEHAAVFIQDQDCSWNVSICYQCSHDGSQMNFVKIKEIDAVPDDCGINIDNGIMVHQILDFLLDNNCDAVPCSTSQCTEYHIQIPLCLQHKTTVTLINGIRNYKTTQIPCDLDLGYCEKVKRICIDEYGTINFNCQAESTIYYGYNCTTEPQEPPHPDCDDCSAVSECFHNTIICE